MAGRPAKPVVLHMADGNKSHLTKADIKNRSNSEIKFGGQYIKCPAYVQADATAYEKWKEIAELYIGVDFVAAGDAGLIARYCVTHSEYLDLVSRRERIDAISKDNGDVADYLQENDSEFNYRVRNKIMDGVSTGAVMALDMAINKKMDMLIKMEDRLFLNPLAKLKNVPKKEEEKPADKMQAAGFDL